MNNRKVEDLLSLIDDTQFLQVGTGPITSDFTLTEPTGDPNHEVVLVKWLNEKGEIMRLSCPEFALNAANFHGNELFMGDQEGDAIVMRLFNLDPVEIKKTWGVVKD